MKKSTFKKLKKGDVVRVRSEEDIKKVKSYNPETEKLETDGGFPVSSLSSVRFFSEWSEEEVVVNEDFNPHLPDFREVKRKDGRTYIVSRQVLE